MKRKILYGLFTLAFLLGYPLTALGQMGSANYRTLTSVLSGDGTPMSSESYLTHSTLGQPSPLMDPDSIPHATNYYLFPGFWYTIDATMIPDADGDGVPDDADNCPDIPNGPAGGTCTEGDTGNTCMSDGDCGGGGFCSIDQENSDGDSLGDVCDPDDDNDGICDSGESDSSCDGSDNCRVIPNGLDGGTCTEGMATYIGFSCLNNGDCGDGGFCSMDQEDTYPPGGNECGDVCECEGNFDGDLDVDGMDALTFKADFGRRDCEAGSPCNGNFNCDSDVDGLDAIMFKIDFGRRDCPLCEFSCY